MGNFSGVERFFWEFGDSTELLRHLETAAWPAGNSEPVPELAE